ncbi:MAG: cation:proton antiporter [Candidatus Gracilibacteria bacterium]|nr:cation:proton antiporter [Candidatus Gracilibacteria bacterium]
MEVSFLSGTLSLLFLLTISSFTFLLSKKINFPYTVLLVIVGLLLVPLSQVSFFNFINHFELTPEILFFVFLPVLLFESAYNINYRQLLNNWKSISTLAVIGLIISAFIVGAGLYFLFPFIGFEIPFLVCLLFGVLISATDPVAVLAIFKSIGAPRRLALIFEGESLFNDGTALALFLIVLGIIIEGSTIDATTIFEGVVSFISMAVGGMIFGGITGIVFSKIIGEIKNSEAVEITLTMVLAHLTFILAEFISEHVSVMGFHLQISGVIATTIAGIIIGNYGRYKISPKVEHHMERFWEFFAFVANSLVFILMGLILSHVNIDFTRFILPIFVVILVVSIARAISIYIPIGVINLFKIEERIPIKWQHLLSWGSLRGALALMMALMIPGVGDPNYEKILAFQQRVGWNFDFDIKDFVLVITIGSIMFTLLIKATTISWVMKKMGVSKLSPLEEFEYDEGKILTNLKILEKLNKLYQRTYLTEGEYLELKNKYEEKLQNAVKSLKTLLQNEGQNSQDLIKRAISLHALGVEKQYLKDLFGYNEITEHNFKFILHKITRQVERLEAGKPQLNKSTDDTPNDYDIFERFINKIRAKEDDPINRYVRNRTRVIITRKVIKELKELMDIDFGFDKNIFLEIIKVYEAFHNTAREKMNAIAKEHKTSIMVIEARLTDKTLLKLEEQVVNKLYDREIITPKLYIRFIEEIEKGILTDIDRVF